MPMPTELRPHSAAAPKPELRGRRGTCTDLDPSGRPLRSAIAPLIGLAVGADQPGQRLTISGASCHTRTTPCARDGILVLAGPAVATNLTAGDTYEETVFLNEALRVVNGVSLAQGAKPLFLYYAAHTCHEPYEITDSYAAEFAFINVSSRQVSLTTPAFRKR